MKSAQDLANEANYVLLNELINLKGKKIALLFSGGADSVWLWALMKKSNLKFDVFHSVPSDISNKHNKDYINTIKFLNLEPNIQFIKYPIFSKELHLINKKYDNYQAFRVFESFAIKNNLFLEYDIIIRGEDLRLHTPFLLKSSYKAYNRKIGFAYWTNKNRFKGEHIISSLWNATLGSNYNSKYLLKSGLEIDFKKLSYSQCHKMLCDDIYNHQTKNADKFYGSFYGKRNTFFPFLSENFKVWSNDNIEDICSIISSFSLNEYKFQKKLIFTALSSLGIPKKYFKSKATLGVQKEMLSFLKLDMDSSYSTMEKEWIKYLKIIN